MAKMIKPLAFFVVLSIFLASVSANHHGQDPRKKYSECKQQCQRAYEPGERRHEELEDCLRGCKEEFEERQGKGGDRNPASGGESQSQEDNNPYVFQEQHFQTFGSEHGKFRILRKFSDHSKHLRGFINAFRFAFLEANAHAFVLPHHVDAELVLVVVQGRGRISLLRPDGRQSENLKQGDILRVPAGTTTYLINRDRNEKLIIANLIQPIATPGEFQSFFGVGAKNPESFLRAFSSEILAATFGAQFDRIERLLDQQKGQFAVKASEEQIRSLSQEGEEGVKSIWPFGSESKNKINLFDQRPSQSNEFGELREVNPSDFRPFEDLDVGVSFANITKGGMSSILFNSKAFKISVVRNGDGKLEMACPHLAQEGQDQGQGRQGSQEGQEGSQEEQEQGPHGSQKGQGGRHGSQEQSSQSYEKVEAPLRKGVVFITPPGHPFTMVASNNQNLEVLCFEINARNNEKTSVTGKNNVFDQMEKVAKELSFNRPSQEVDEVVRGNNKEGFTKGPNQQQQGRAFE